MLGFVEEIGAPLAAAMKAYAASGALAFHTPGHKQGLGAHPLLKSLITEEGLREEVSLMSELDDLHRPCGCIREAEERAARLWGADEALFMVNGTTGAIHAMMMACLEPGDEVIVPRNAHCSVAGGLVLTGARPVYVEPAYDEALGIAHGVTAESVRRAIESHPKARAVLVVYPTYYGVAADLRAIAEAAHEHGLPLLADEAHGAHFAFSNELPEEALACGADLVAQSTHKLLGSLTQTSMLFRRGTRVPSHRVRRAASLLTSTSPNYLLMASLDIARLQMEQEGSGRVGRALRLAGEVRGAVNDMPGLWCFGAERTGRPGSHGLDATKLTVNVTGLGMTGTEAERILRASYGLQAELADARNVLFLLSMADTEREAGRLSSSLADFAARHRRTSAKRREEIAPPPLPRLLLSPREAFFAAQEAVPFREAAGRVAAETVTFYPPGVPVLTPGEEVTQELVEHIGAAAALGLTVTGPDDPTLATLRVVRQNRSEP